MLAIFAVHILAALAYADLCQRLVFTPAAHEVTPSTDQ